MVLAMGLMVWGIYGWIRVLGLGFEVWDVG